MAQKTVLIVDDSKFARLSLSSIVARHFPDWIIGEAANGAAALCALGEAAVDFVLLDFNMPGEDGLTVAQKMRELRPDSRIALVTANVQDAIVQQAHALGIGFIPKPVEAEMLRQFLAAP